VVSETTTLDNMYLEWLYTNFIGAVSNRNPRSSYWELSKQLYTTKFTWIIPDDENRAERGKELRKEFIDTCDVQDIEINWLQIEEVSVLEVLVSLACRASFETWGEPGDWFWKFLENLELNGYNDNVYSEAIMQEVDAVIHRWLDREYEKDGVGGLFPRQNAARDQTQLSIWYQMQGYLLEGNYLEHGP
jgi:hypothetical protein